MHDNVHTPWLFDIGIIIIMLVDNGLLLRGSLHRKLVGMATESSCGHSY